MATAPGTADSGSSHAAGTKQAAANASVATAMDPNNAAQAPGDSPPRSYKLPTSALSEDTRRWVRLAHLLGERDRTVRAKDPKASFRAMLCAAQFVDDVDARWLAGQLGATLTAELNATYAATALAPELIEQAPSDVMPLTTSSTETWLHDAALLAFGHRPAGRATPAEVVAAFVSPRALGGHDADYAKLPMPRVELAIAFLEHVRTAHPELQFVFEYVVGRRNSVSLDEL